MCAATSCTRQMHTIMWMQTRKPAIAPLRHAPTQSICRTTRAQNQHRPQWWPMVSRSHGAVQATCTHWPNSSLKCTAQNKHAQRPSDINYGQTARARNVARATHAFATNCGQTACARNTANAKTQLPPTVVKKLARETRRAKKNKNSCHQLRPNSLREKRGAHKIVAAPNCGQACARNAPRKQTKQRSYRHHATSSRSTTTSAPALASTHSCGRAPMRVQMISSTSSDASSSVSSGISGTMSNTYHLA